MKAKALNVARLRYWLVLARRHWLGVVLFLALILYLLRLPTFQVGAYMDDAWYITLAKSICSGQGYSRIELVGDGATTVVPFGYPLLLAPLVCLFPRSFLPLQLLSLAFALGALCLYRVFLRGRIPTGESLLAVLLVAFHPGIAAHASMVMSEMAYIFFTLLALVLLDRYEVQQRILTWCWLGLVAAATISYFVRVPGLVLIGSIVVYLLLQRKPVKALAVGLGALLPIGLWAYRNWRTAGVLISKEYQEVSFLSDVSRYLARLREPLIDYLTAIPHSLIPLVGPQSTQGLGSVHLWLPVVFNVAVLGIVIAGLVYTIVRQIGAWQLYVIAMMGVLLLFRGYGDDRLLLPLVPFLYLCLLWGVRIVIKSWLSIFRSGWPAWKAVALIAGCVLLLNLGRSLQGIWKPVRSGIPDVSIGATWIREHSDADSVVMARIPRVSFIYAERPIVPYPVSDGEFDTEDFYGRDYFRNHPGMTQQEAYLQAVEKYGVDYLLVAPLVKVYSDASKLQLDDFARSVVLPLVEVQSDRFELVYQNQEQQVFVYKVRHPAGH